MHPQTGQSRADPFCASSGWHGNAYVALSGRRQELAMSPGVRGKVTLGFGIFNFQTPVSTATLW